MKRKWQIRMTGAVALAAAMAMPVAAQQAGAAQGRPRTGRVVVVTPTARATSESSLRFTTRDGQRLRMTADIGTVRVRTIPGLQEVTVVMRVETDPRQPDAERLLKQVSFSGSTGPEGVQVSSGVPWSDFRGRLWVRFEVNAPRKYNLEVTTHAGNVYTDDVDGRVTLVSHGGDIQAGNVSGAARLETQGGHVTIQNVGGDLAALTAGGHVSAGNIGGAATLRTAGGHIRVASIQGAGNAETGGGDIAVAKTGAKFVAVSQGGGQITFGEASGAIEARTAGGGIRVFKVAGPMQLNTAGGSIYLTAVRDAVRASTASGNITAWFIGDGKKRAPSQLQCTEGDILVYLPRDLALNIEATIESATNQEVSWDPAIPIKLLAAPKLMPARGRLIRATGTVNGGGEMLKLHTIAGNIRLLYADQAPPAEVLVLQMNKLRESMQAHEEQLRQHLNQEFQEMRAEQRAKLHAETMAREQAQVQAQAQEQARSRTFGGRLEGFFSRAARVDPSQQKEKIKVSVEPLYPLEAKKARVEGLVQLEAILTEDGKVMSLRTISGHPLLVPAAQQAVMQWEYKPTLVGGRAVKVITRIDVEFKLQ